MKKTEFEFFAFEVEEYAEKQKLSFREAAAMRALNDYGFFGEQYQHEHENDPDVEIFIADFFQKNGDEIGDNGKTILDSYIEVYSAHRNGWILSKEWINSLKPEEVLVFYPHRNAWEFKLSYVHICEELGINVTIRIC